MDDQPVVRPEPYNCFPVELWEKFRIEATELSCQVMVAKSPDKFYLRFFLLEFDELEAIRDAMDFFFHMLNPDGTVRPPTKRPIDPSHLIIGLPVSIFMKADNAFFRGVILLIEPDRCRCYLVDVGSEEWIDREDICYLPKALIENECLAIECKIANAGPPPDTVLNYPPDFCLKMLKLSNSESIEKLREQPLVCRILQVIKPQPMEFDSPWRYHRKIFTRLVVELRMPKHPDPIARQPNGFAHLLAQHNLCSISPGEIATNPPTRLNVSQNGPFSSIQKEKKLSQQNSSVYGSRGRGKMTHLNDKQCPPLPFDDEDN